jgi:hypothetical protein
VSDLWGVDVGAGGVAVADGLDGVAAELLELT